MYPASEHDVAGLVAARASVTAALKRFLAADKAPAKAPVRKRLLFPPGIPPYYAFPINP
jgi:hypothetical protein